MHGRTIFAATFVALAQLAVASPPGCLLGAVNEYSDPSDVKSVCKAKDLDSKVKEFCGQDTKAAMKALEEICGDAGVDCKPAFLYPLCSRMWSVRRGMIEIAMRLGQCYRRQY
jgi:hypothetical protein